MFDEKIIDLIENNPKFKFYKAFLENGFIIMPPSVNKYIDDKVKLNYHYGKSISRQLIIDMISYDDSYYFFIKLIKNECEKVYITFIGSNGEFLEQYSINRNDLMNLLKKINIENYSFIKERYNKIMEFFLYNKFKEKVLNDSYVIDIDNTNCCILVKDILSFVELSNRSFNYILNNLTNYCGVPLPYFLYAVNRYYKDNKIIERYDVDINIINRIEMIKYSKIIDIQMINEFLKEDDFLIKKIHLNEELENEILKDLPSNFNSLEKAIYLYIKICKLLTYDEEVYASNLEDTSILKHKNINYIQNITLNNNSVVCYEFNAIYSYFLNKFKINYKNYVKTLYKNGWNGEMELDNHFYKYGDGHSFLKFRCGKFFIKADAVISILQSDMTQSKLNKPLKGLTCLNENEKTKEDFSKSLYKVYNYIINMEIKNNKKIRDLEDLKKTINKINHLTIIEKVKLLIESVNSSNLSGMDAYSYLIQLKSIIFSKDEENLISISLIKNCDNSLFKPIAIISLQNKNNVSSCIETYMYKVGENLIPISKEDLQSNFDDNTMGYIDDNDPVIPCLKKKL